MPPKSCWRRNNQCREASPCHQPNSELVYTNQIRKQRQRITLQPRKCLNEIIRNHTKSYELIRNEPDAREVPVTIPTVFIPIKQVHAASCRRLFLLSSCCVMLCYICLLPCVVLICICKYSDPCGSYEHIIRYIYMVYKCTVRSSIAISCLAFG